MMKQKMVMCLLAGVLVLGIGGCGAQEVEVPEVENVETAEEEPVPEETAEEEGDEQEKTDAEDQLKEVPTVDDAAESGKTEPEETEAASASERQPSQYGACRIYLTAAAIPKQPQKPEPQRQPWSRKAIFSNTAKATR